MGRAVGIDLGTTYSAVAVVNDLGRAEIVPNREGENITPSVVMFQGETAIVGTQAKRSAVAAPEHVISLVKRHMGETSPLYTAESGRSYRPEEISALILRRLREDAELYLGEPVDRAVITVPAYFDDARRTATIDAGKIAGLRVLRIINEPTAAALAYGMDHDAPGTILVYDLGGGTFDVTVMSARDGALEVLATDGDRNLGGFDWDNALMTHLNERFRAAGGADLLGDDTLAAELRDKAEIAKRTLSMAEQTTVMLSAGGRHEKIRVTREEFEKLTAALLGRTRFLLGDTLDTAGVGPDQLDRILLVGGSTRMPQVVRLIEQMAGRPPEHGIRQDEVVALGAALLAAALAADGDAAGTGETGGAGTGAGTEPVPGGGLVTVSGGKWSAISDVTSQSLGILCLDAEQDREVNSIIVARNSRIPASATNRYRTAEDEQTQIEISVTQGEDEDPEYVTVIGTSVITLPLGLAKHHPVEIHLSYDVDGIVHVEVADAESGIQLGEFEIDRSANMDREQVRRSADLMRDDEVF